MAVVIALGQFYPHPAGGGVFGRAVLPAPPGATKSRRVGMDTPVTIGILTAFLPACGRCSITSTMACILIRCRCLSFAAGRALSGRHCRRKAGAAAESLVKLTPAFCHRSPDWPASQDSEEAVAPAECGRCGARARWREFPGRWRGAGRAQLGERIALTGESRPLPRAGRRGDCRQHQPGFAADRAGESGGAKHLAGRWCACWTRRWRKTLPGQLADRFAGWFVAVLLLAAAASYLGWLAIAPDRALWIMVAVLVVSRPCALSLATPAALTAATGHLGRHWHAGPRAAMR